MPDVIDAVRARPESSNVRLLMTDKFPQLTAADAFNKADRTYLRYETTPIDATDLTATPDGLKTMVNSFHHLRPAQARSVLASAQANRQPLLIYEMGENKLPFALWVALLPLSLPLVALSCWFLTPFVRPLTTQQLLFTYLIPIIPIFYAWDGQASMPRLYGKADIDELLSDIGPADGYAWQQGAATTKSGGKLGVYVLGLPST